VSATPSPATPDVVVAPPKKKKLLLIIVAALVLVLAIGGGAAAWVISKRNHALDENGDEIVTAKAAPKVAPTFMPMENMVVNLADPGGERFAQIGITLEVASEKISEELKPYIPAIRSGILVLISQKTSTELLQKEGKETLAKEIIKEVSKPLGYPVEPGKDKNEEKSDEENPIKKVLFSSFIIQ
jgi:flagellar protein FliL